MISIAFCLNFYDCIVLSLNQRPKSTLHAESNLPLRLFGLFCNPAENCLKLMQMSDRCIGFNTVAITFLYHNTFCRLQFRPWPVWLNVSHIEIDFCLVARLHMTLSVINSSYSHIQIIISPFHHFQMVVEPSGPAFDLAVPLQVVIGTIPLQQIFTPFTPPPSYDVGMEMNPPPAAVAPSAPPAGATARKSLCISYLN